MRFFLLVILIAIFSAVAGWLFPWWSVAVVAFFAALFVGGKHGLVFLAGFLGAGLCWGIMAVRQDVANAHILSTRMAALFHLPSYGMFIVVTIVTGGLVGGLAAWSGGLLKPRTQTRNPKPLKGLSR